MWYEMRMLLIAGAEIPWPGDKFRVVMSVGENELHSSVAENENGWCAFGKAKQGEIKRLKVQLPADTTQVPDVFVYLVRNKDNMPISYKRISADHLLEGSGVNLDFGTAKLSRLDGDGGDTRDIIGNMADTTQWITLSEDDGIDDLPDDEFPGCLLLRLGLAEYMGDIESDHEQAKLSAVDMRVRVAPGLSPIPSTRSQVQSTSVLRSGCGWTAEDMVAQQLAGDYFEEELMKRSTNGLFRASIAGAFAVEAERSPYSERFSNNSQSGSQRTDCKGRWFDDLYVDSGNLDAQAKSKMQAETEMQDYNPEWGNGEMRYFTQEQRPGFYVREVRNLKQTVEKKGWEGVGAEGGAEKKKFLHRLQDISRRVADVPVKTDSVYDGWYAKYKTKKNPKIREDHVLSLLKKLSSRLRQVRLEERLQNEESWVKDIQRISSNEGTANLVDTEVRVHVYQARALPPSDPDGSIDAYFKVNFEKLGPLYTSTRLDTTDPLYYETLKFNLKMPKMDREGTKKNMRFKRGEASPSQGPVVVLKAYDDDMLMDSHTGTCVVPLSTQEPTWCDIFHQEPGDLHAVVLNPKVPRKSEAPQVLVSVQLIQKENDVGKGRSKAASGQSEWVPTAEAKVIKKVDQAWLDGWKAKNPGEPAKTERYWESDSMSLTRNPLVKAPSYRSNMPDCDMGMTWLNGMKPAFRKAWIGILAFGLRDMVSRGSKCNNIITSSQF
jgi:hypothetical protein